MKISDLTFIDLGLPSGNKFCFQLVDNLYRVAHFQNMRELLPSEDEMKELFLFCDIKPYEKSTEIEMEDSSIIENTTKGIMVNNAYHKIFIPFLGNIVGNYLEGETEYSIILNSDSNSFADFMGTKIGTKSIEFGHAECAVNSYVQILLVKRDGH